MNVQRAIDAPVAAVRRRAIGFLFVGGVHQMLHIAPAAVALARRGDVDVVGFVAADDDAAALGRLLVQLGAAVAVERLPVPRWAGPVARLRRAWRDLKLPRLLAARARLARLDVLVTAERTSTILTRLPGRRPLLVHIPHGAGDRARGFEPRIARFDHVIVSGAKDRDRMIAQRLVTPDRCSVSGSIKLAAVAALPSLDLFGDGRPVVLYNPHFDPTLSSWPRFGRALVDAFARQDRFNLVVAPHVRLFAAASARERAAFAALAVPGRIIVDPGSERSCDMTYTRAAAVYVGDVSSQVYEFVHRPRPCVFLDPGVGDWVDDPSYAFWHFGEVITDPAAVLAAIACAPARHAAFAARQRLGAVAALGDDACEAAGDAAERAASIIAALALARAAATQ